MNGADYIATVRLSTKENVTLALPGQTCERVPATSLPYLRAHNPPQIWPAAMFRQQAPEVQAAVLENGAANVPMPADVKQAFEQAAVMFEKPSSSGTTSLGDEDAQDLAAASAALAVPGSTPLADVVDGLDLTDEDEQE